MVLRFFPHLPFGVSQVAVFGPCICLTWGEGCDSLAVFMTDCVSRLALGCSQTYVMCDICCTLCALAFS